MTGRNSIGQILLGAGRIDEEDVERALAYQQKHGGYFGEALIACGLVSEGELEWGLASQFDLPYVFPDADSIDHEAAAIVGPEWALTHGALPILRTDTSLTVVVDSPLHAEVLEELKALTALEIELALASPSKIRELIRQVFARAAAAEEGTGSAPRELVEVVDEILGGKSPRFGLSVRGPRAWAWWDEGGAIRRRRLAAAWRASLDEVLQPGPSSETADRTRHDWSGRITVDGTSASVDVRYIADESGSELLFLPRAEEEAEGPRFDPPGSGVLSEVQLLARTGKARFVVTAEPSDLGHEILPHLPGLLLDPSWRSIYINAEDQPAADQAFSRRLPTDPETWATELETLRAFHFDAVTVDLAGREGDWTGRALDVASVAFLLWVEQADVQAAYEAGVRWKLHIARGTDGGLDWTLDPLPV